MSHGRSGATTRSQLRSFPPFSRLLLLPDADHNSTAATAQVVTSQVATAVSQATTTVAVGWGVPYQRTEAGRVRGLVGRAGARCHRTKREEQVLPCDCGARRPGRGALLLHRHQGQGAQHQRVAAHRARAPR